MQLATYAMIANLAYVTAETGNTDVTMALYRPPGQGASARQRELRPPRSDPGDVSALVLAIAGACSGNPA
jgi:hypothetical protein